MNWKKIGLSLLYPHLAVIICLLPISISFLVLSLIYLDSTSIISILSYLLSFYVLLTICFRVPKIVEYFKKVKQENKYIQRWFSDTHLRMNVSLYGSLIWNVIFAIFQLVLGFYHKSLWFYTMFAYYVVLGLMRFFLVKHTRKYKANEEEIMETKRYILCGWMLLIINLTLSIITCFIVYWNKTFNHHMITTIAMAAYTFFTFTFAIVNLIKYKKYNSLVYSAAKNITLISACVSMLTLETTMLTTFGGAEEGLFRQIILSISSVVVIGFAISMAIYMIVRGNKRLKQNKEHLKSK